MANIKSGDLKKLAKLKVSGYSPETGKPMSAAEINAAAIAAMAKAGTRQPA